MYESNLPKLEPVADTSFASEAMAEEEPLIQGLRCHKGPTATFWCSYAVSSEGWELDPYQDKDTWRLSRGAQAPNSASWHAVLLG